MLALAALWVGAGAGEPEQPANPPMNVTLGAPKEPAAPKVDRMAQFLLQLPKAEMHIHLEGTLEPGTVLELARKNQLKDFPYTSVTGIQQRMGDAKDLPSFIAVYNELLSVLRTEEDFYEVAWRYFNRVRAQNVVYVELFFDPQMHTSRGIPFATVMAGLNRARHEAQAILGLKVQLILCLNRDRSADSAMKTLEEALPYKSDIVGIGLDNPEEVNFPQKFKPVYDRARAAGFRLTSHCDVGVPNTLAHIRDCLDVLGVERIDHGVSIIADEKLMARAKSRGVGFTVCPALLYGPTPGGFQVRYYDFCVAGAKRMLAAGLMVTLSSDDPGIMVGQYVGEVYVSVQQRAGFTRDEMVTLARNGFLLAWITEAERKAYLQQLDAYVASFPPG